MVLARCVAVAATSIMAAISSSSKLKPCSIATCIMSCIEECCNSLKQRLHGGNGPNLILITVASLLKGTVHEPSTIAEDPPGNWKHVKQEIAH